MDTKKLEEILQNQRQAEFKKAAEKTAESQEPSKKDIEKLTFKKPANTSVPEKIKTIRKYFALEEDNSVPNIQFRFKNKALFFLPYATHPYIEYDPDSGIKLETMQKLVLIKGRDLDKIVDHISNQNLDWLMESPIDFDNQSSEIYVQSIEVFDR